MILTGSPEQIQALACARYPGAAGAVEGALKLTPRGKQELYPYQAAALFGLAHGKKKILEIGTYYGFSAVVLAWAAPGAEIVTLNPRPWEADAARANLKGFANVRVVEAYSWDYLEQASGLFWDLIFVDGDHKEVRRDLPWWNRVEPGGLFLFHDYSPNHTPRPCPPVYRALNEFIAWLGRGADVSIIDDNQVGMIGFIRRAGDPAWSDANG